MQMSSRPTLVQDTPLLKVEHLSVNYGGAVGIRDVSLEVASGAIVTIAGANGAGKTTLLRAISGMVRASAGEIWFQNVRIDGLSVQRILELGISHVPEGKMLFGPMSVLENLLIGAYSRKDRAEISNDLDKVLLYFPRLMDRLRQAAGTLSGGEQQMLAIARGLMSRPKLLLADEPSLGLSPLMVENIVKIVQEINQGGVTVFLVEQNAFVAFKISHWGYILQTGQVALAGDTTELLQNEQVKKIYLGIR
jgi:branched-chain amino acid transport system ATP-binding protein